VSLWLSAAIVLAYTYLGGLSSAIYNEVLQFFIILIGLLPIVILTLMDLGGWSGLKDGLAPIASQRGFAPDTLTTTWKYTGSAGANPLGVEWYGIFFGLGFVLSFGYWCTNFLIVQRAMAAESTTAARKTPLIGALPKMFIPFLIIVPGIAALVLINNPNSGFSIVENGKTNYDLTIIMLLKHYLPAGVLASVSRLSSLRSCRAWREMYLPSIRYGLTISIKAISVLLQTTGTLTRNIIYV
jgi:SSS family solute:Na+ symporter